jgi:hypothetical protein
LGLTLVLSLAIGLGGSAASAQEEAGGWAFTSLPFADLWFHGMALVDPVGPGPSPLYDPGYPGEIRRAKETTRVRNTGLDAQLGHLRGAFRRDPAFEVLHFLPLYFSQAGRTEILTALELLVTTEEGLPRAPSTRTAFGLAAVGSVLTTPEQRTVLGEFVSALEDEWARFYQAYWQEDASRRQAVEGSLRSIWASNYEKALTPFLDGLGMSGGLVAMVPAIGGEGRIFPGSPQNPGDIVLVVSAPAGSDNAEDAVFSMLRELSFPLVRRVMEEIGVTAGSPNEEESLAAKAAVRSGALVLEVTSPDALAAYHRFFLSQIGRSSSAEEGSESAFREGFSLPAGFEEALRIEILATITNGGIR